MNKYNLVYNINGRQTIFSLKEELTEHLKRHLDKMIENKRNIIEVVSWLEYRGYQVVLK